MDIRITLLFTVTVVTALLSLFTVRSRDGSDRAGKAFSLFVIAASLWALFIALFLLSTIGPSALRFASAYYIAAAGIAAFFLFFSLQFPDQRRISPGIAAAVFAPFVILITLLIVHPGLIVKELYAAPWGKGAALRFWSYLAYNVYFAVFIVWAYRNLIRSYLQTTSPRTKSQLKIIFLGTVIPYLIGMTTNLFLPWVTYRYVWIGPLVAFVMVVAITFAISRRDLLNVRVIGAEFFSVFLFVTLLIRFLLSQTTAEFILGGIILAITGFIGVLLVRSVWREVHVREQMEKLAWRLEQANVRLKELDQAKTEFISIASHQLRTPVTAIKGYSSMLLEKTFGDVPEKMGEPLDRIFRSSENLVRIIENFLNVSRIELGKMQYDFTTFDLRDAVRSVVENARVAFSKSERKRKDLTIAFTDRTEGALVVNADQNKIEQVIGNLVDNAMKYTPRGTIEVVLSLDPQRRAATVAVRDTGIGIAKGDVHELFEKFKRVNARRSLHATGAGLGLYVAKEIIKEHKGRIWVESPGEAKGSTFYVELPLNGGR